MKKIILFFITILSGNIIFAQSFSGPSSALTGSTITLTAVGETAQGFNTTGYNFNAITQIDNSQTVVTSPSGVNPNLVNFSVTQVVNVYGSSNQPTTIKVSVSNPTNFAITARFYIQCTYYTGVTSHSGYISYTITVNPTPPTYGNSPQSATFTKNNCGPGYVGTQVTITVPANQFTSNISYPDANQKAINYLNAQGQSSANAQGTCLTAIFVRTEFLNSYTVTTDHKTWNEQANQYITDGTTDVTFADITLKTYSDAACTIPLSLTNPLTVNISQSSTYGPTTQLSYTVPAGSSSLELKSAFPVLVVDNTNYDYDENIFRWDVIANGTDYVAKPTN
ncbi:DUF5977 domain-containing protein [Mucilaginibacter paludis]|uniref:DUF5977 domain-containing protein n=1 Tax=Mucilaginibacter paludis DSM 18603 TaxID=714943 RepID=H1XZB3_9SPHI|nr:DUF5977 domain-containing protein [Mucilaginibacter paludis]EHQ25601.1 hypothetical protein Mucpa_1443 [Mucilaginibacter paludis DSM 18603]